MACDWSKGLICAPMQVIVGHSLWLDLEIFTRNLQQNSLSSFTHSFSHCSAPWQPFNLQAIVVALHLQSKSSLPCSHGQSKPLLLWLIAMYKAKPLDLYFAWCFSAWGNFDGLFTYLQSQPASGVHCGPLCIPICSMCWCSVVYKRPLCML